jgi:thymidylate kinase
MCGQQATWGCNKRALAGGREPWHSSCRRVVLEPCTHLSHLFYLLLAAADVAAAVEQQGRKLQQAGMCLTRQPLG